LRYFGVADCPSPEDMRAGPQATRADGKRVKKLEGKDKRRAPCG
jgi:hypothetical protein